MLPMGTIVTACMFAGLIAATPSAASRLLPPFIRKTIGAIVLIAGLWNVLWYSVQHLSEFWGQMAFASGALMIITALYLLMPSRLPNFVRRCKLAVLLALLVCALIYAITIARL